MEREDVPKFGTGNGKSSFPSELPLKPGAAGQLYVRWQVPEPIIRVNYYPCNSFLFLRCDIINGGGKTRRTKGYWKNCLILRKTRQLKEIYLNFRADIMYKKGILDSAFFLCLI